MKREFIECDGCIMIPIDQIEEIRVDTIESVDCVVLETKRGKIYTIDCTEDDVYDVYGLLAEKLCPHSEEIEDLKSENYIRNEAYKKKQEKRDADIKKNLE